MDAVITNVSANSSVLNSFNEEEDAYRVLQPVWNYLLRYEKQVHSPFFPVIFINAWYISIVTLFTIADALANRYDAVRKHRVNPQVKLTWKLVSVSIAHYTWNNVIYILPLSIAQATFSPSVPVVYLAPTLWEVARGTVLSFFIFDLLSFLIHIPYHRVKFLYKYIHGVHHAFHSPIAIYGHHLHPLEMLLSGSFAFMSVEVCCPHLFAKIAAFAFNIFLSIESHCGYDLPFTPDKWLPFCNGSAKHNMHHRKPLTNIQPFFNYADKLLGWDCPPYQAGGDKSPELVEWEQKTKMAKAIQRQLEISSEILDSQMNKGSNVEKKEN